jgi:hypothetical protein
MVEPNSERLVGSDGSADLIGHGRVEEEDLQKLKAMDFISMNSKCALASVQETYVSFASQIPISQNSGFPYRVFAHWQTGASAPSRGLTSKTISTSGVHSFSCKADYEVLLFTYCPHHIQDIMEHGLAVEWKWLFLLFPRGEFFLLFMWSHRNL